MLGEFAAEAASPNLLGCGAPPPSVRDPHVHSAACTPCQRLAAPTGDSIAADSPATALRDSHASRAVRIPTSRIANPFTGWSAAIIGRSPRSATKTDWRMNMPNKRRRVEDLAPSEPADHCKGQQDQRDDLEQVAPVGVRPECRWTVEHAQTGEEDLDNDPADEQERQDQVGSSRQAHRNHPSLESVTDRPVGHATVVARPVPSMSASRPGPARNSASVASPSPSAPGWRSRPARRAGLLASEDDGSAGDQQRQPEQDEGVHRVQGRDDGRPWRASASSGWSIASRVSAIVEEDRAAASACHDRQRNGGRWAPSRGPTPAPRAL